MTTFDFTVIKGHQIASGLNQNSPFGQGTISLQKPFFKQKGLDIDWVKDGTINAWFRQYNIVNLIKWDYQFKHVKWHPDFNAESFRFAHCHIVDNKQNYPALIYQPIKETKIGHSQPNNVLELLSSPISHLNYKNELKLIISSCYLFVE